MALAWASAPEMTLMHALAAACAPRYDSGVTSDSLQPAAMREIKQRLRKLPRERRREIALSIREGRAVNDPRDAPLAVAWAERLAANAHRSPASLLPLTQRPTGWRAWAWLIHLAWVLAALTYVYYRLWHEVTGTWHWVLLGFLAYTVCGMPFTVHAVRRTLHAYWNAPDAAKQNRQLAG